MFKTVTVLLIRSASSLQSPGFQADVFCSFYNSWVGSCELPALLLCEFLFQMFVCFASVLNVSLIWV